MRLGIEKGKAHEMLGVLGEVMFDMLLDGRAWSLPGIGLIGYIHEGQRMVKTDKTLRKWIRVRYRRAHFFIWAKRTRRYIRDNCVAGPELMEQVRAARERWRGVKPYGPPRTNKARYPKRKKTAAVSQ